MQQADGLVFVADSQLDRMSENVQAWENFQANLRKNGQSLDFIPMVLQYNKRDLPNAAPVEYLEYLLNNGPRRFYSFESAASRGHNVLTTLNTISHEVLTRFAQLTSQQNETPPAPSAPRPSPPAHEPMMAGA
jgi:signal recognition particle receptor subunit beta